MPDLTPLYLFLGKCLFWGVTIGFGILLLLAIIVVLIVLGATILSFLPRRETPLAPLQAAAKSNEPDPVPDPRTQDTAKQPAIRPAAQTEFPSQ